MKDLNSWLERHIIFCLAASMIVPVGAAETNPGLRTPPSARYDLSTRTQTQTVAQGAGGTATLAEAVPPTVYPDSPGSMRTQAADQAPQSSSPQSVQTKQDSSTQAPAGTAAAPYQKQEGVSASKPGGAAIAPGKQRRIHSFAIRVGLLVGAGIAIGVVTAATMGSSSRP